MDAVTYPDKTVSSFIAANMVPLLIPFDKQPYAEEFNVKWTPTIITLDHEGKEHHRTVGFLAPDQFVPSLKLGIAKNHFDNDRFDQALEYLKDITNAHSRADCVPEAIYLEGVSLYKKTHDPQHLKNTYNRLKDDFPENEWTKRAAPYRLI